MPPAVIAGGIAAVGTIGGALISSGAQSSAANQAAASQASATQAQLQLGRESMALNRDIYNSNYNTLSPFVSRGNVAGQYYNALLGLPAAPTMTSPLATASGGAGQGTDGIAGYNGPSLAQIQAMQHDGIPGNYRAALSAYQAAQSTAHNAPASTPAASTPATPAVTAPTAQAAYNVFANSAGIGAQMDALNQNYAAKGLLQSGAAMKGIQQSALNNYFLPYLGLLNGQQAMGAQSASAIAGVGSNFGNTAANINSQMGSAIQNGADGASNAALARGYAGAQLGAGIAGGLGSIASSFMQPNYFGSIPAPSSSPWPVTISSPSAPATLPGGFY